jgi:hypothetical protein
MALVAVAMTCGNGTRFTDSFGGCNSYAQATIGTNAIWLGPKFTILYRLDLINIGISSSGARVGVADVNGSARRFWLAVVVGASFTITGNLNTTACGSVTVFSFTKTKDTSEHSVAWTYDANGNWVSYWDGAQQSTGAAPCSNLSGPAAVDDVWQIAGTTDFGGNECFNIDRVFFADDVAPASQILDIHTNCGSF